MSNFTPVQGAQDTLLFPDDGHCLICVDERRPDSHPNGRSHGNPGRCHWHNQIEDGMPVSLDAFGCCGAHIRTRLIAQAAGMTNSWQPSYTARGDY